MQHNRIHVPATFVFYLFAFIFLTGILVMSLLCYYQLPNLEERFGIGSFVAFDLEKPMNFLTWFFSAIWLLVVIESFFIVSLSRENRLNSGAQIFWVNVAIIALLLSVNSICGFYPFLQHSFDALLARWKVTGSSVTVVYIILRLILATCLFTEISFLFKFLKKQECSRWFLSFVFCCCFALFGLAAFCWYGIPVHSTTQTASALDQESKDDMPNALTPVPPQNTPSQDNTLKKEETQRDTKEDEKEKPKKNRGLIASKDLSSSPFRNASQEDDIIESDKTNTDNNEYVNVSQTESNCPNRLIFHRWEDLFGWNESFENKFGLSRDFEYLLGWHQSIESFLLGSDSVQLDLVRLRVVVRYGMYGFALIAFCIAVALVARGGKLLCNKRLKSRVGELLDFNDMMAISQRNFLR